MTIPTCHPERTHYCKGMCKPCYRSVRYKIRTKDRERVRRAPGPPDCHPERKHEARGMCGPCYKKHLKAQNREGYLRSQAKWRLKNKDKRRISARRGNLKYKFGITPERYEEMLAEQAGCCAICWRHERQFTKRLAVDHDHATGAVRGLLCGPCNVMVGYLENPEWFARASDYLSSHKRKGVA